MSTNKKENKKDLDDDNVIADYNIEKFFAPHKSVKEETKKSSGKKEPAVIIAKEEQKIVKEEDKFVPRN